MDQFKEFVQRDPQIVLNMINELKKDCGQKTELANQLAHKFNEMLDLDQDLNRELNQANEEKEDLHELEDAKAAIRHFQRENEGVTEPLREERQATKNMTASEGAAVEEEMLLLSASNIEDNLFDDGPVIERCILGNRYHTRAMIDSGRTAYSFIDTKIAHDVCDALRMSFVELLKLRQVKGYDGRMDESITHAIYPSMVIRDHTESSTPLLIIRFGQHAVILDKLWMRAHGVSNHGHDDIIFFLPGHCTHMGAPSRPFPKKIERIAEGPTPKSRKQEKCPVEIMKRPKEGQVQARRLDEPWRRELKKIETLLSRVRKKGLRFCGDEEAHQLRNQREMDLEEVEDVLAIYAIGAASSNVLSRQKDVKIFAISIEDVDIQLQKMDESLTDPKSKLPK